MQAQTVHSILGYLGLLPFIGLSIFQVTGITESNLYLLSYATLILSFLGGTLWSSSIALKLDWSVAVFSNLLMLLAWMALMFHQVPGIMALVALLLIGTLVFERFKLANLYHSSLLRLRSILTTGASASLLFAEVFTGT